MCIFAAAGIGGALSSIASIAGSVIGAIGAIQQGKSAQAVAEYNAKVAENNALAEQQRAAYESGQIEDRKNRIRAQQVTGYASNGLLSTVGSPSEVLTDTSMQGELDVLARLYQGESAATANRNDATRFRAEGKAAKQAAGINAMSSLIGGIGSLGKSMKTSRTPKYEPLRMRGAGLY